MSLTVETNQIGNYEIFEDTWTDSNIDLKEKEKTTSDKIREFALNFFLFIPKLIFEPIVRTIILPISNRFFFPSGLFLSKDFKQEMNNCFDYTWSKKQFPRNYLNINSWFEKLYRNPEILNTYHPKKVELVTPDHVKLDGHLFLHKNHDHPNARVMLVFGGNGEYYKTGASLAWLMDSLYDLDETPVSFLAVNPRGCDSSGGHATRKGIIIDAETMYSYAKKITNGKEENIDIYGHSFGGAVAMQLKARHGETKGHCIVSRTYSDSSIAGETYMKHAFGDSFLMKTMTKVLIFCAQQLDWRIDNRQAVEKIKDPTLVFYHYEDSTIPYSSNLASYLNENKQGKENFHVYEMITPDQQVDISPAHLMPIDTLPLAEDPSKTGTAVIRAALRG